MNFPRTIRPSGVPAFRLIPVNPPRRTFYCKLPLQSLRIADEKSEMVEEVSGKLVVVEVVEVVLVLVEVDMD